VNVRKPSDDMRSELWDSSSGGGGRGVFGSDPSVDLWHLW